MNQLAKESFLLDDDFFTLNEAFIGKIELELEAFTFKFVFIERIYLLLYFSY